MGTTILILRILHIGFGSFWVGTDLFLTFVVMPRLRSLRKDIERPAALAMMRAMPPLMMTSSLMTALSGVGLTGILRGWNFTSLTSSGWGAAIVAGFVGTLVNLVIGFGLIPPVSIRLEKLATSFEGRKPSSKETSQLDDLTARAERLSKINAVLLVAVVISMAVARYV